MTPKQREKLNALSRCTFAPASYQKRFVRDLKSKSDDYELSVKQNAYLDKLFWMYRKQHGMPVSKPENAS